MFQCITLYIQLGSETKTKANNRILISELENAYPNPLVSTTVIDFYAANVSKLLIASTLGTVTGLRTNNLGFSEHEKSAAEFSIARRTRLERHVGVFSLVLGR